MATFVINLNENFKLMATKEQLDILVSFFLAFNPAYKEDLLFELCKITFFWINFEQWDLFFTGYKWFAKFVYGCLEFGVDEPIMFTYLFGLISMFYDLCAEDKMMLFVEAWSECVANGFSYESVCNFDSKMGHNVLVQCKILDQMMGYDAVLSICTCFKALGGHPVVMESMVSAWFTAFWLANVTDAEVFFHIYDLCVYLNNLTINDKWVLNLISLLNK